MGWFDFFMKLRPAKKAPSGIGPRLCHLYLAHLALPRLAFSSPYHTLGILGSTQGKEFLDKLLASVEEHSAEEGEADTLPRHEFRIHTGRVHKFPCTLLELPAPRAAPEANILAMMLKPPAGDTAEALVSVELRYFTLEMSEAAESRHGTQIGEWTEDGEHISHGPGPAANVAAFLKGLEQVVAEKA